MFEAKKSDARNGRLSTLYIVACKLNTDILSNNLNINNTF